MLDKASIPSSIKESLSLSYPSYILALAMGSGKTFIIASIIAIEFAIAIYYENNNDISLKTSFMKNTLVFAPGKTIYTALKKISTLPFDKILPPYLLTGFLANVRFLYVTESKDIPIIENSFWQVVITNTEKIIAKKNSWYQELEENLRLNKIKSLPNLGIFSDEAHHTYGNTEKEEIKRVRETINRIHKNRNIICAVNTTGTPYINNQILKDTIYKYSLQEGIRDNILKSLHNRVLQYQKINDDSIRDILNNFFTFYTCGNEKIAFYFKSEEELEKYKIIISESLLKLGYTASILLKNTMKSTEQEQKEFDSLDEPNSTKRVILMIHKGKEGWDCKTLFATALISNESSSNITILQSSTRCLRQIEGNIKPATIYISQANAKILNRELSKYYGTNLDSLAQQGNIEYIQREIILHKKNIPKLEIKLKRTEYVQDNTIQEPLSFILPSIEENIKLIKDLKDNRIVTTTQFEKIALQEYHSLYLVAQDLASEFHISQLDVYNALNKIYPKKVPMADIPYLKEQISQQKGNYKEEIYWVKKVLALIRYGKDGGFQKSEDGSYYYHTLQFREDNPKIKLLQNKTETTYSFHYSPLNFDSNSELDFHKKIIDLLGEEQINIEDIYFTGGLGENFTDFHFEYKGEDNQYHKYFPDFLIKKKTGEMLIVEIKDSSKKEDSTAEKKAEIMQEIESIPENKVKYIIIYADRDGISEYNTKYLEVNQFIGE